MPVELHGRTFWHAQGRHLPVTIVGNWLCCGVSAQGTTWSRPQTRSWRARCTRCATGADHSLTVTEIDLASEAGQRLAAETGVLFVPGVLVDGKPFTFGRLSERKLRRALAKRA